MTEEQKICEELTSDKKIIIKALLAVFIIPVTLFILYAVFFGYEAYQYKQCINSGLQSYDCDFD